MSHPSEPAQKPDWASEYVRACLRVRKSVPHIEELLVARGLTPAAATAVVTSVLEEQVGQPLRAWDEAERRALLHRILSAVFAGICILLGYWFGAGYSAAKTALWILGPLACIWFPEYFHYWARMSEEDLRWIGWAFLILIGAYRIVLLAVFP